jgi:hypothetical protein
MRCTSATVKSAARCDRPVARGALRFVHWHWHRHGNAGSRPLNRPCINVQFQKVGCATRNCTRVTQMLRQSKRREFATPNGCALSVTLPCEKRPRRCMWLPQSAALTGSGAYPPPSVAAMDFTTDHAADAAASGEKESPCHTIRANKRRDSCSGQAQVCLAQRHCMRRSMDAPIGCPGFWRVTMREGLQP